MALLLALDKQAVEEPAEEKRLFERAGEGVMLWRTVYVSGNMSSSTLSYLDSVVQAEPPAHKL